MAATAPAVPDREEPSGVMSRIGIRRAQLSTLVAHMSHSSSRSPMRHRRFPLSHLAARCRTGLGPRIRIHHRQKQIRTARVEFAGSIRRADSGCAEVAAATATLRGRRQPFPPGGLRLPGGLSRSSIGCCREVGRCGRVRWWGRGCGRSQGCAERTSKRLDLDGVVAQQNRWRFGDQPDLGCPSLGRVDRS